MAPQNITENPSDLNMIDEVGRRKMEVCRKVLINQTSSNDFKLTQINRNKKSDKNFLPDFLIF